MAGRTVQPATMDTLALGALGAERLDWRFKGMPSSAFGHTVDEFLSRRPTLSQGGFVGPLLVLDQHALEHNLRTMAEWCARHGLQLAPHGKTTMAPQLFRRQLAHGAWAVTAATISQLRVYRAFGVSRVVLANQMVDPNALRWLAAELDHDPGWKVTCWVDSVTGVALMTEALSTARPHRPVDVLVELGGEHGRTGTRTRAEALEVARAVRESPVLRLTGVAGYEAALAHDLTEHDESVVDAFMEELRGLVADLTDAGHFSGVEEVIVTCGGSSYFDQVADALTKPWPQGLPVVPVLRSGAYLTHDDGLYRTMSPFGRTHRLAGREQGLRPAMRIWSQVVSHPEPGLALMTMGRRDVSFDQGLPEPQVVRTRDGEARELPAGACRVTSLADQHAFLSLDAGVGVDIGDWIGFGLSHPCTVFDKWPLIPVVDGDEVVDLVRTYF